MFVQRDGTATLLYGDAYINRGLHMFTLRWGKVYTLEEFQASPEAARGLAVQATGNLKEAPQNRSFKTLTQRHSSMFPQS